MITHIDYIDYSPEYGFFGNKVAVSDVRGMTEAERFEEVAEMREILGDHITPVICESIPRFTPEWYKKNGSLRTR